MSIPNNDYASHIKFIHDLAEDLRGCGGTTETHEAGDAMQDLLTKYTNLQDEHGKLIEIVVKLRIENDVLKNQLNNCVTVQQVRDILDGK